MTTDIDWKTEYFDALAKLQQEIAKNVKLKEEIDKLKWAATSQD